MSGGLKINKYAKWVMANHKGRPQRWASTNARPQNGGYGQNAHSRNRAGAEKGASHATKEEYGLVLSRQRRAEAAG